jgi:hypothetical protein
MLLLLLLVCSLPMQLLPAHWVRSLESSTAASHSAAS